MYELINKKYIKIREYKGQRVVTFKDIDTVHERPEGTARKRFNKNKKHFIEEVDYFVRNTDEAKNEFNIIAPNGLILLTESGYLMIVKSFTDDHAWEVQRALVNSYFRLQQIQQEQSTEKYPSMTKDDIVDGVKFLWERVNEYKMRFEREFIIMNGIIMGMDLIFKKKVKEYDKTIAKLKKQNRKIIRALKKYGIPYDDKDK